LVGVLWRKPKEGHPPSGQRPGLRVGVDQDHVRVHVFGADVKYKDIIVCLSKPKSQGDFK